MTCSGVTGQGLDAIWQKISDHRDLMLATGDWESHRSGQKVRWMWSLIEDRLIHSLREDPEIAEKINLTEQAVRAGSITPLAAAETILHAFRGM
jgi:LAO/AO transport system kinase